MSKVKFDDVDELVNAEVATVEDLSEDQPGNEPDATAPDPEPDDEPPAPTAAVA